MEALKSNFVSTKMYAIGGGTMEEIKPVPTLPMFCKVTCYGYGMSEREAAIISGPNASGTYKTVYLSNYEPGFGRIDQYSRPHSKKHGIGSYYDDNLTTFTAEEVEPFIKLAEIKEKKDQEIKEAAEIAAKKRAEYLSQFKTADRRQTSNLIKKHILSTWKTVSKVEVRSDVYSMGSSLDVTYHAPEKIQAVEDFINSFQYGHFNSMEDIYEHGDNEAPTVDGYILQQYKYASDHFTEAAAPVEAEAAEIKPASAGTIQIVDYSEKAIAVIGDFSAYYDKLIAIGGSYNTRLKCGKGIIFSKKKLPQVQELLG